MKEKERSEELENEENEGESEINVDVTVQNRYVRIRLKRGATLQDLIDELINQGYLKDVSEFTIMLDGRIIRWSREGGLSEDPVLTQNSTLSLTKQVKGGASL